YGGKRDNFVLQNARRFRIVIVLCKIAPRFGSTRSAPNRLPRLASLVRDERRLRLRELALDVRDPLLAGRMIREERRRLLALGVRQHPLPEVDRRGRVVTRLRHEDEADVIRLALLLARERQFDAALAPSPEGPSGHLRRARL